MVVCRASSGWLLRTAIPSVGTNPMQEAITQLLRCANRWDWVQRDEGAERLFHHKQVIVATKFDEARAGMIAVSYECYTEWKETSLVPMPQVASALAVEKLGSQVPCPRSPASCPRTNVLTEHDFR